MACFQGWGMAAELSEEAEEVVEEEEEEEEEEGWECREEVKEDEPSVTVAPPPPCPCPCPCACAFDCAFDCACAHVDRAASAMLATPCFSGSRWVWSWEPPSGKMPTVALALSRWVTASNIEEWSRSGSRRTAVGSA